MNLFGGQVGDAEAWGWALGFTTAFLITTFALAFGLALTEVGAAAAMFGSTTESTKAVSRVSEVGKQIFNDQTT